MTTFWQARAWAEVAHYMALVPLAWLLGLHWRRIDRDAAWWWLALAFSVSWLADSATALLPRSAGWVPGLVYPVAQTGLIAAVLLPRSSAWLLVGALVGIALAAAVHVSASEPDLLLRTAADFTALLIVVLRPELPRALRAALIATFGLGWLAWVVFARTLVLPSWYAYQSCRAIGLAFFCAAVWRPSVTLTVLA